MISRLESELAFLSIAEASRLLRRKEISSVELVSAVLSRITRLNPSLNAFITVVDDAARREAKKAGREIRRGESRGPLHGIPISLKDNIETHGILTTAGSRILGDFIPAKNSVIAERLARAGAILVGKTNLHEFAYGVTTENPFFGTTRNPWLRDRIPGGSSGGSGAAVAAGLGFASVGTDTGGSIRIPSALCGIVGLKPTFGLVSLEGVVPLAESLDHAGPMARTVADASIMLEAIAGRYPKGARLPDFRKLRKKRPFRFRIGWPKQYFFDRIDDEVLRAVKSAVKTLESLGGRVAEVSLPHLDDSVAPSTSIALAEATQYHESRGYFPERADEYSSDLRHRLEQGRDVRAVDYLRAREQQSEVMRDFDAAFDRVDVITAPTTPIAAPPLGTKEVSIAGEKETVRAALLRLNRPANYTGHPAISLPCGFTRAGLPIGLQIIGPLWGEAGLLEIAFAYEQATEWHKKHPDLG
ncbi:MAG: amidase [Candidatus Acidiferrales bacterium]